MNGHVAVILAAMVVAATPHVVSAQSVAVECGSFIKLREDAQQKALAVRTAVEKKAERKDICTLVQHYYAAESTVIEFLEDNKTWCGIPNEAIKAAKENHEHTAKFRIAACREAPAQGDVPSAAAPNENPPVSGAVPLRAAVPLKKAGGTFVVPVKINGAITLDF